MNLPNQSFFNLVYLFQWSEQRSSLCWICRQRWGFIKENKKTHFRPRKWSSKKKEHALDQEKKKNFLFSLTFLFSFINSHLWTLDEKSITFQACFFQDGFVRLQFIFRATFRCIQRTQPNCHSQGKLKSIICQELDRRT